MKMNKTNTRLLSGEWFSICCFCGCIDFGARVRVETSTEFRVDAQLMPTEAMGERSALFILFKIRKIPQNNDLIIHRVWTLEVNQRVYMYVFRQQQTLTPKIEQQSMLSYLFSIIYLFILYSVYCE